MEILFSDHLNRRLRMRAIAPALPKEIFENAKERYLDAATGHEIAISTSLLYGRMREIMVAYHYEGENVKLLTIHPLKEGQKDNRINSGRWRRI